MQSQKVTDMTVEELKGLILQVVNENLQVNLPEARETHSIQEILKEIKKLRWTPPAGTTKASQMIIEERKQ